MATSNHLTILNAEAARRMNNGRSEPLITLGRFQNCTLPGLFEFFLSSEAVRDVEEGAGWRGDTDGHPLDCIWGNLLGIWSGDVCKPLDGGRNSQRDLEFFLLNSSEMVIPDAVSNLRLHEFEARLVNGGKLAGMPPRLSYGLASVVHELVENVFQHSDGDKQRHFRGVVGYHSMPNYFALSVGDLGVGTLNTLRLSPDWTHLCSDRESLDAIVTRHASRKPSLGEGEGFKTVIKNLVDRNAFIELRSGNTAVRIKGADGLRAAEWRLVPALKGLHVNVVWKERGLSEEECVIHLTQ